MDGIRPSEQFMMGVVILIHILDSGKSRYNSQGAVDGVILKGPRNDVEKMEGAVGDIEAAARK